MEHNESNDYVLWDEVMMMRYDQMENNEENDT